ncbi:MAG: hypothetical protein ACLUW6_01570 [Coriobacteriaceae bacterium]
MNDAYTASVGDLAGDESVQQKMTCTAAATLRAVAPSLRRT